MFELTQYRTDLELCEVLVRSSKETAKWIGEQGVRMWPGLGRQAYKVDGRFRFWGGLALHIEGGGPEMLSALYAQCEKRSIPISYETCATDLVCEGGRIAGVVVTCKGEQIRVAAPAVVLACGGFESSPEMRAKYLGPGWDLAKVRGTRFNMGAGLRMGLAAGARTHGHFSGCHSVAWDINAPPYGDLSVGDKFQKHNYPYGIIVNAHGKRYVDEGANFHSHTYAKYGGEILRQPGMFAWQIFDHKSRDLLRAEYRIRQCTKVEADTIEELAAKLDGVDAEGVLRTLEEFNSACRTDIPFNPNVLDGRRTEGLEIDKTNWANPIDTPPFHAYHVTTGVTFTFGGLKATIEAEVEAEAGGTIAGLYAAGEVMGGLFVHNYASGTGLMAGSTFGRIAGRNAARFAIALMEAGAA